MPLLPAPPSLTEPQFVQVPGSVRSRKRRSNECFEHLVHVRMLLLLELLHEQGILLKQLPDVLCGRHDWKVQVEPRSATMKEVFMLCGLSLAEQSDWWWGGRSPAAVPKAS